MHIPYVYDAVYKYWYKIPHPPLHHNWSCIAKFTSDPCSFAKHWKMEEKYVIMPYANERSSDESLIVVNEKNKELAETFFNTFSKENHDERDDLTKNSMFIMKFKDESSSNTTLSYSGVPGRSKTIDMYLFKKGGRFISSNPFLPHALHAPEKQGFNNHSAAFLEFSGSSSLCSGNLTTYSKSEVSFLMIEYSHENLEEPIPISFKNTSFISGSEILTPIFIYYYFKYELGEARTNEIFNEKYTLSILDKNMKYIEIDNTKYIYIANSTYMVIKTS